jgi:hypothetical protein
MSDTPQIVTAANISSAGLPRQRPKINKASEITPTA